MTGTATTTTDTEATYWALPCQMKGVSGTTVEEYLSDIPEEEFAEFEVSEESDEENTNNNSAPVYFYEEGNQPTANIITMLNIKQLLESPVFEDEQQKNNPFYNDVIKSIQNYMKNMCSHDLVRDLIDLDGDRSHDIVYCTKCETTFRTI